MGGSDKSTNKVIISLDFLVSIRKLELFNSLSQFDDEVKGRFIREVCCV